MLTSEAAQRFADAWLAAWNTRDLTRILAHYAEDVRFHSPFAVALRADARGCVRGRAALGEYFARGLAAYPDLRFELRRVYAGIDTLVLEYLSVNGLVAAECMRLNDVGQVIEAWAHYAPAAGGPGRA